MKRTLALTPVLAIAPLAQAIPQDKYSWRPAAGVRTGCGAPSITSAPPCGR
jgi:hypothetical protein